jgi:hypothetical protein
VYLLTSLKFSQNDPDPFTSLKFSQNELSCAMIPRSTTLIGHPIVTTQAPERPGNGDNDPRSLQFGRILAKIRYGGSDALSQAERMAVVEIFRAAAITADKRVTKLKDEITCAHLEYCYRLPNNL